MQVLRCVKEIHFCFSQEHRQPSNTVWSVLFDLESTIRRNELHTCTSVPCVLIKRKRLEENAVPIEHFEIQKSEYGKQHKDYMKPFDFNPFSGSPTQSLTNKFYDALLETATSCVALSQN